MSDLKERFKQGKALSEDEKDQLIKELLSEEDKKDHKITHGRDNVL